MNENLTDHHAAKRNYFRKEWVLRLFANPFFGIVIGNVTPLVSYQTDPLNELIINYSCFSFVSFCLWLCNRSLLVKLRKSNSWIKEPVIKTFSILAVHFIFSYGIAFVFFYTWNYYIAFVEVSFRNILIAAAIAGIISILVTFLYEILLLTNERRRDLIKAEKLNHAMIQAELDTLKSQIDPHFIFNSLNTLSALISDDKEKALLFNENLAKVYRYILSNRANDLVTVKEEIDFINSYFFLLKIRFEDSLRISMKIDSLDLNRYYLPTIAIQTAIENAIKHNKFSSGSSLIISIELTSDYAIVSNNKNPVRYKAPSSGVGLFNLDNRYKLILNKSIHIDETTDFFTLYLPIVKR